MCINYEHATKQFKDSKVKSRLASSTRYVPPLKVRVGILVPVRHEGFYQPFFFCFCGISEWNFTKLACIYQWEKRKSSLGFGDFDPVFKVTRGCGLLKFLQVQYLVPMISLELIVGISPNLHGFIIGRSLKADKILVILTSFSRSQEDFNM